VTVVADSGFSGRLELRTASLVRADASITKAIKDNGLSESVKSESVGNTRVLQVACSREALDRLMGDLNEVWRNCESATLVVEADGSNDSVIVKSVTLPQTREIIRQDSADACLALARETVILDRFEQEMPGQSIVAAASGGTEMPVVVPVLPKPTFTGPNPTAPQAEEGTVQVSLTIVLVDARP
jgi:hypothetical protein